jgi:hypothetical protein
MLETFRNQLKNSNAAEIIKFLPNFKKKTSLNSPDLRYQFPLLFACFFFITRFWRAEKSRRVFLNEKLVSRLKWNYRPSPTILFLIWISFSGSFSLTAIEAQESWRHRICRVQKKVWKLLAFLFSAFTLGKKSFCPSVRHSFYSSGGGPIWMILAWSKAYGPRIWNVIKKFGFWNRSWTWPEGFEVWSSIFHKFFWTFYKCVCVWERERECVCTIVFNIIMHYYEIVRVCDNIIKIKGLNLKL